MSPPKGTEASRRLLPAALLLLAILGCGGPEPPRGSVFAAGAGGEIPDPPCLAGSFAPYLAVGGEDLLLSWIEPVSSGAEDLRVRFARLREGEWSEPATVVEGVDLFANWADVPSVAEGTDGVVLAHWLEKLDAGTYSYGVKLGRSTDTGRSWQPLGWLHDDQSPSEHGFVSLLASGDGFRAFWLDGRETVSGGPMTLRAAWVGDEVSASELVDDSVCDCCPTAAALAEEGPVVVYRSRRRGEVRDIYRARETSAGWAELAPVHADHWVIEGCPVNGPAVAARGAQVAVAWFTAAGGGERAQVAFSTDGGATFGARFAVDADQAMGRVGLALDRRGVAWVVWLGSEEATAEGDQGARRGGGALLLRSVDPDSGPGPVHRVATTTASRSAGVPRIAYRNDRLFLAWVEPGETSRIRVEALDIEPLAGSAR